VKRVIYETKLREVKQMDDVVFTNAVEKYRKTVFRAAYNFTGNYEDAEDISQEAFVKLYSSKKAFADNEHIKAFLIRVAINAAKSFKRTSWQSKRSEADCDIPYYDDVADRELFDCVMRLPPKYRAAVYLYYYEDYNTEDAAKIMGTSKTAFTTRLSRAREQLKKTFDKGGIVYERKYQENV